ncbi:phage tail assembly chaperone G [Halalkalibacter krulwichiae]|uniref:Uncharacterized protein n=1 Tax=Halalkalibacter krulwichiae TaxID=199441 RepID=A0A1X9MFA1_9BACI|nr:hypothetical protein [Halalkalibacter krulwichiae]ARK32129.1 hypothetical protein BkAM31D_21045 [Halalkalibacter krulwichiae]
MKIELYIEGEKKLFTVPFVPIAAKRRFLELEVKAEERGDKKLTAQEQLDEDDEFTSILVDIVFKNQFTLEQVYEGASKEYMDSKLIEAIWGIKPTDERKPEDSEGNNQGE